MKNKSIAALVLASLATASTAAFASGYGPAPQYRPSLGAPASQRGQSVQTLAVEKGAVSSADSTYGSDIGATSESGKDLLASRRSAQAVGE